MYVCVGIHVHNVHVHCGGDYIVMATECVIWSDMVR